MTRIALKWILIAVAALAAEMVVFGLRWPWFGRRDEQV